MSPQACQPAVGQHANVALGPAGDLGDLAIGQATAPKVEGFSLSYWEMGQQSANQGSQIVLLSQSSRVRLAEVWRWGDGMGCTDRIIEQRLLAASLSQVVNSLVAADAKQPGGDAALQLVLRLFAEFHECMLDSVVGQVEVIE